MLNRPPSYDQFHRGPSCVLFDGVWTAAAFNVTNSWKTPMCIWPNGPKNRSIGQTWPKNPALLLAQRIQFLHADQKNTGSFLTFVALKLATRGITLANSTDWEFAALISWCVGPPGYLLLSWAFYKHLCLWWDDRMRSSSYWGLQGGKKATLSPCSVICRCLYVPRWRD